MNKKRVLIVTDYFVPHWTGIVSSITYFIEQYSSEYEFEVLTVNHTNTLPAREKVGKIFVSRVPYHVSISRAKISFVLLPKYIQMIQNTDTVFINSPHTNAFLLALLGRLFGKRVVIFHQADLILPRGGINWLIERFFDIQTHISCFLSHAVATYTNDYAKYSRILSHHLDKLQSFIFVPKKMKITSPPLPQMDIQKKQNKILFGFAGRYVEEKGIDVLMKAIRKVIKQTKDVHFFFAGEAPSYEKRDYFAEFNDIEHYISNLGVLSAGGIITFMNTIDALILPSRSECFGMVQIEAFLAGKPVIVSNIPGARVPVITTKYGYIFESENEEELAQTIIRFIDKKNSLSPFKKNYYTFLDPRTYDSKIRTFIG